MTDETIGTVEAHEVILERCPTGCGHWKRATLPMKWEQDVEHGFAIPIVGCGNPWHYTNLAAAPVLTAARCGYLIRMLGLTPFICNRAEDDALHRSRTHPDAHSFLTATPTPERLLDAIEAAR